jgi:hypothetical protein
MLRGNSDDDGVRGAGGLRVIGEDDLRGERHSREEPVILAALGDFLHMAGVSPPEHDPAARLFLQEQGAGCSHRAGAKNDNLHASLRSDVL